MKIICNYNNVRIKIYQNDMMTNDLNGEARVFELPSHPFFIGTLFQPERAALNQQLHPIIAAFLTQL